MKQENSWKAVKWIKVGWFSAFAVAAGLAILSIAELFARRTKKKHSVGIPKKDSTSIPTP